VNRPIGTFAVLVIAQGKEKGGLKNAPPKISKKGATKSDIKKKYPASTSVEIRIPEKGSPPRHPSSDKNA